MRVHSSIGIGSRGFATSILAVLVLASLARAAEVTGGRNDPDKLDRPYLLLISIDGFGWNYRDLYETPALDRIARDGVQAKSLRPAFPTLTFPNHYSIATGLYPAQHGIVHNHFPNEARDRWYHIWDRDAVEDGSWYSGDPIWAVAEMNGLVSAAYYFVGTEAPVGGIRPSYWYAYNDAVSAGERVDQVLAWLQLPAEQRPHVITLYFENVDDAGHDYGQGSTQLEAAVTLVDREIGRLRKGVDELGLDNRVAYFVVSDHGHVNYAGLDTVLVLEDIIDLDGLTVQAGESYAWIYQDEPDRAAAIRLRDAINSHWQYGVALLREDTPDNWRISDSRRYPDVFVVPELHYAVVERRSDLEIMKVGDHGWAPEYQEMHGFFVASGPGIAAGRTLDTLDVVDLYAKMLEILGIRDPGQRNEIPDENRLGAGHE